VAPYLGRVPVEGLAQRRQDGGGAFAGDVWTGAQPHLQGTFLGLDYVQGKAKAPPTEGSTEDSFITTIKRAVQIVQETNCAANRELAMRGGAVTDSSRDTKQSGRGGRQGSPEVVTGEQGSRRPTPAGLRLPTLRGQNFQKKGARRNFLRNFPHAPKKEEKEKKVPCFGPTTSPLWRECCWGGLYTPPHPTGASRWEDL